MDEMDPASTGFGLGDQGLTDCHVHIFGSSRYVPAPRFPHPEEPATLADLEALGSLAGVRRYVLTQPSFLGFDNSLVLGVLAARPAEFRGVIWLDHNHDPALIEGFAAAGIAGLRFPLKYATCLPDWAAYDAIFAAAAKSSVHVELGLNGSALVKATHRILDRGCQIVVAHLGMFDADRGPDADPAFEALLDAAKTGRVWIKLSAPYRASATFADRACERILEAIGPERTVWGSDWPHVGPRLDRKTTYPSTLEWLLKIAAGEEIRRTILVASPETLYGFAPAHNHQPNRQR